MPKMATQHIKHKSGPSPLPTEVSLSKRRPGVRQDRHQVRTPSDIPSLLPTQPLINRAPRPARWRGTEQPRLEQPSQTQLGQPAMQSICGFLPNGAQTAHHSHHPQIQGHTELRFSFSAEADDNEQFRNNVNQTTTPPLPPSRLRRHTEFLSSSFSELSVGLDSKLTVNVSQPKPTATAKLSVKQVVPELTVPKKQREGYGFSYSESMWYDSDEYPDTECDWEPDSEGTPTPATNVTTANPIQDSSFADVVVLRDVGSFHIAKPQKRLPCTSATREDTIRLKHAARSLFKYEESVDVYAELVGRLERMVHTALQGPGSRTVQNTVPTATYCVLKLRDFLLRIKTDRIDTGENRRFVEHEIEWAEWLVEASRTGVMHLKGLGCKCRPDWEDQ